MRRHFPAGRSLDSFPDGYDLLDRDIIDSIGILEMSGAVRPEFEIELDLEHLDAESLTKISPFCRSVKGSAHAQVKESAQHRDDTPGPPRPIARLAQLPYAGKSRY